MQKRNLALVLQEMEAAKKAADIDLEKVPFKNRASLSIAKTDATVKLKSLREEYAALLRERVVTVFVAGSKEDCQLFAQISDAQQGTLSISADAMYEKMAADIEPTIGAQRMFGGTQLQHLIRSVEDCGRQANLGFLQVPRLIDVIVVKPPVTTMSVVKDLVTSQLGHDLNARWIESKITEMAIEEEFEKLVPVVVLCSNVDDVMALKPKIFTGRGIGEVLDKPVTPATVQETISRLRESLKK